MKHVLFGLALVLTAAGCGGGKETPPEMAVVSGTIKSNGKPLTDATVSFSAAGYPPNTMEVVDGNFKGRAMIGANKISISSKKKAAASQMTDGRTPNDIKRMQQQSGANGGDAGLVETITGEFGPGGGHLETVTAGDGNVFNFNIK